MSVDLSILEEYARQRRREIASDPRDIRCSVSLEELEGLLTLAADAQIAGAGLEQAIGSLAELRETIKRIGEHLVGCSERLTKKYRECDQGVRTGTCPETSE